MKNSRTTPEFPDETIDFTRKNLWLHSMERADRKKYEAWSYFVAGMIVILLIVLASILAYFYFNPIQETNDLNEHKNELSID